MYLSIVAPPTPLCIVDRRLTIIPQSVWDCNKRSERLCCYVKLPVQTLQLPSSLSAASGDGGCYTAAP